MKRQRLISSIYCTIRDEFFFSFYGKQYSRSAYCCNGNDLSGERSVKTFDSMGPAVKIDRENIIKENTRRQKKKNENNANHSTTETKTQMVTCVER